MSFESAMVDAIYTSAVAVDAVYVDASGAALAVRAVPVHDPELLLGVGEVGVSGPRKAFRLRKATLPFTPVKGDRLQYDGADYCVDHGPTDLNETEWLVYVVT